MNLMIIEDDIDFLELLWKTFRKKSLFNNIKLISSYSWFLRELHMIKFYDIILVDIILLENNLYKENWIQIVKNIRDKNLNIPIIIMTWLSEIEWLEKAFQSWINDYIVKPFRFRELELRIESLIRLSVNCDLKIMKELIYNWLKKDMYSWDFFYKNEKIRLKKNSKFLLSIFLEKPEKILNTEYLINKIWSDNSSIIERNPRINILRLKNDLKKIWIDNRIQNIRWEWYVLKK